MQIDKSQLEEIINLVVTNTIKVLEDKKLIAPKQTEKSAYAKTESLLYNYYGFKKILEDRKQEIEELRKYGVPGKCGAGGERVQNGGLPHGIVLDEERVEAAVHNIEVSVQGIVDAIALIDKCMSAISKDPYYKVLEMRYFEGRTQEDIATAFGCTQKTISVNKSRLVKELSMRMFPNQVVQEMLS